MPRKPPADVWPSSCAQSFVAACWAKRDSGLLLMLTAGLMCVTQGTVVGMAPFGPAGTSLGLFHRAPPLLLPARGD